jgi:DNA transformation protein
MSEFVAYLDEVFELFGPISARRMFGGYGIYHEGVMFGLVADDTLYLKADDATRARFDERDLPPFQYDKNGKMVAMSYFLAPEELYEDRDVAREWATCAYQAAVQAKRKRK